MLKKHIIASITTTSEECVRHDAEFVAFVSDGETIYHINYVVYNEKLVLGSRTKTFENYNEARAYYMNELLYLSDGIFLASDNDDNRLCFD